MTPENFVSFKAVVAAGIWSGVYASSQAASDAIVRMAGLDPLLFTAWMVHPDQGYDEEGFIISPYPPWHSDFYARLYLPPIS